MKSSRTDEMITAKLEKHAKSFQVSMTKLREKFREFLPEIEKEHSELSEDSQKVLAYRRTTSWIVNNYIWSNSCETCFKFLKGKCEFFPKLKQKKRQLKKLDTFSSEEVEQIKDEICELEEKMISCRKNRTIQQNRGYSTFKNNKIPQKPSSKKVNKPAVVKNQVSLKEYFS